ncbi:hypothetical protein AKJ40_04965, partial [candidate division MSBL1 archaeon SCGC-AAA259M10]
MSEGNQMVESPKIDVRVFRLTPEMDEPKYEAFEVPKLPKMTVLDALEYITEEIGRDIAYRSSCGIAHCGQCAVSVNGERVLACLHMIEEDKITIEPLPNFPIIRDLVVDFDRRRNETQKHLHLIRNKDMEQFPEKIDPTQMEKVIDFSQCIECQICQGVCPIIPGYMEWPGPSHFSWVSRFNTDPRDGGKNNRLNNIGNELWYCSNCNSCVNDCPWEIPIRDGINELRSQVIETGFLPKALQDSLESTLTSGSPYQGARKKRNQWISAGEEKAFSDSKKTLYFVGCTSSYDTRAQEIPKALVKIFDKANIEIGILDDEETCCGGPIKNIGEIGLFEMLKDENIKKFNDYGVENIVTHCPHSFNTFKKDYLEGEGDYKIYHH